MNNLFHYTARGRYRKSAPKIRNEIKNKTQKSWFLWKKLLLPYPFEYPQLWSQHVAFLRPSGGIWHFLFRQLCAPLPFVTKTVWNKLRNTHIQTHEQVILFKPDHKLRSGLARGLHQSWGGVRIGELLTQSWLKCSGRSAVSLIPLLPQSPRWNDSPAQKETVLVLFYLQYIYCSCS